MKRNIAAALLFFLQLAPAAGQAFQMPQQNIGIQTVINAVEKPFRIDSRGLPEIDSVSADFFQRSTIAARGKEFRADGQMYLKPASGREPLKFRFDYSRPTRHQVVCDGRTLWVYLPENRQVIQNDVAAFFDPLRFDPARDRAINFLQGLGRISRDFTIRFNNPMIDVAGNFILELTPVRASATIEKLFIIVNKESLIEPPTARPPIGTIPARNPALPDRPGTRNPFGAMPGADPPLRPFPILSTTVVDHEGNSTTLEFSNVRTNGMLAPSTFDFFPPPTAQVVRPPTGRQ